MIEDETFLYTQISIVFDRIWVINHKKGIVYQFKFDGENDGEIQLDSIIIKPLVAVQLDPGRAVIAVESGLFCVNGNGQFLNKITEGNFSFVCYGLDDILYALMLDGGKIMRFQFVCNTFRKQADISLQHYTTDSVDNWPNYKNTFVFQNGNIYVCFVNTHFIIQYDMVGNKIKTTIRNLNFPAICGSSCDNYFLVTSHNGKYIGWLNSSGKTEKYLSLNYNPWCALWQNANVLWVLDDINRKL